MKLKDKIKSYSFWVSLASAIILILKVLGSRFGFTVDESMVSDFFTAICSILVLLGIIVIPQSGNQTQTKDNNNPNIFANTDKIEIVAEAKLSAENQETLNQPTKDNCAEEVADKEACSNETNTQEPYTNEVATEEAYLNENIPIDDNVIIKNNSDEVVVDTNTPAEPAIENTDSIDEIMVEDSSSIDGSIECNNNPTEVLIENQPEQAIERINSVELIQDNTIIENPETCNLKSILSHEREKFANDINQYIFELEEELRKARENL